MYFAVNAPSADLRAQALMCLQTNSPGGRWFALLDRAFDQGGKRTLRWPHPTEAIYKGTDDIEAISPTLLALNLDSHEALAQDITCLLRHCQGRPMLSFVQTTLDMGDLATTWQDIKWVHAEDGQRFLWRLADTRVLSSLPQALQPHNWARMCKPLMAWHIVDRVGALQALKMPPATPDGAERPQPHEPRGAFQINDKELTLLLEAAQPDVLINSLFEQVPEVLPTGADQAKVHAWVRRACDLATQHGLESTDDQLTLAATACLTEGRVLDDPALPGVLAGHRPGQGALADELAALLPAEADAAP
jgi:Domain of unknown function (DUF4123)